MTPVKVVGAFTECVVGAQESSALTRRARRSRQSQPLPTHMADSIASDNRRIIWRLHGHGVQRQPSRSTCQRRTAQRGREISFYLSPCHIFLSFFLFLLKTNGGLSSQVRINGTQKSLRIWWMHVMSEQELIMCQHLGWACHLSITEHGHLTGFSHPGYLVFIRYYVQIQGPCGWVCVD